MLEKELFVKPSNHIDIPLKAVSHCRTRFEVRERAGMPTPSMTTHPGQTLFSRRETYSTK